MSELQVAERIIRTYLEKDINIYSANDLLEIANGNNELLLEHIETLIKIFNKAKEQLEKDNDK